MISNVNCIMSAWTSRTVPACQPASIRSVSWTMIEP